MSQHTRLHIIPHQTIRDCSHPYITYTILIHARRDKDGPSDAILPHGIIYRYLPHMSTLPISLAESMLERSREDISPI